MLLPLMEFEALTPYPALLLLIFDEWLDSICPKHLIERVLRYLLPPDPWEQ